jgi:ATP-dependent DNA ligase
MQAEHRRLRRRKLRACRPATETSVDEALIDGEAVVLQDDGRSDFSALMTKRGWRP